MNIYLFKGLPGVGKSTVASLLAKELNAPLINKDDINDIVFNKYGVNKKSSSLVYELIYYLIRLVSNYAENIVVDCSLARKRNYLDFVKVAKKTNSKLLVIEVYLNNYSSVEKRLNQRGKLPEHRIKTLEDINKQGLEYDDYDIKGLIRVENSGSIKDTLSALKTKLSQT